jgi:hypothetical protein
VVYRPDEESRASPIDYLERWHLHNAFFADQVRFLRVVGTPECNRLIIEQPAIAGTLATSYSLPVTAASPPPKIQHLPYPPSRHAGAAKREGGPPQRLRRNPPSKILLFPKDCSLLPDLLKTCFNQFAIT